MRLLRRLTYRPQVVAGARLLHASGILKKLYYRWAGPADGVLRLNLGGIDASFYAQTAGEFRTLESVCAGGEEQFLSVLASSLREGDVFYDIGSNIGLYAIPVAKLVGTKGQVIAFEPQSGNYDRLQAHVQLNGLTNVRAFRKALGEANGNSRLLVAGSRNAHSRLVNWDQERGTGTQWVDVVKGDDFCRAENLPRPRVVKIDVEGGEFAVLKGLNDTLGNPACQLLCCEIHPRLLPLEVKPEAVLGVIRSLGFTRIESNSRGTEIHVTARKGTRGYGSG